MKHYSMLASILYCFLLLSACASWNSSAGRHEGMCRTLKSSIVFNGATTIARQADIERAERHLQQSNYDRLCT